MNPIFCVDFYKTGHIYQYPEGTEYIYSNLTPRSSINGEKQVVWFGLQYFLKKFLIESFDQEFFSVRRNKILKEYKDLMRDCLNIDNPNLDHIANLHELGYLPLKIKSLDEGSIVPLKIPVLTIRNTLPEFYWLTNYIETALSCMTWKMSTSATTAYQYKKLLTKYALETTGTPDCVQYQAHDFSFRGMSNIEDAAMSGAGHLTCFKGTDTIPAIKLVQDYYGGTNIGGSIPATEHSVMCAGTKDKELDTIKRLLTEVYPEGMVSIVSDTWDLWNVLDNILPQLRGIIDNRPGRVVIRPDSGDPVEVSLKTVESLIDTFGSHEVGPVFTQKYKRMSDKLGVIYGDGITLTRCEQILEGLKQKGYSSDNMVFGVGSYTYQYKTRDNLGWAMKATWAQINGEERELFKDPVTDNGNKRSAKGLLTVVRGKRKWHMYDQQPSYYEFAEEDYDSLTTRFKDGKIYNETTLDKIRSKL